MPVKSSRARRRRNYVRGTLVVGGYRLKVRLTYDPYNKVWEAKLSKSQLRSLLRKVREWKIMHTLRYDPNYDGLVAGEMRWRRLSEEGKEWIMNHDLKYADDIVYNPKHGAITVYLGTYGNLGVYHLQPNVQTKLIK